MSLRIGQDSDSSNPERLRRISSAPIIRATALVREPKTNNRLIKPGTGVTIFSGVNHIFSSGEHIRSWYIHNSSQDSVLYFSRSRSSDSSRNNLLPLDIQYQLPSYECDQSHIPDQSDDDVIHVVISLRNH